MYKLRQIGELLFMKIEGHWYELSKCTEREGKLITRLDELELEDKAENVKEKFEIEPVDKRNIVVPYFDDFRTFVEWLNNYFKEIFNLYPRFRWYTSNRDQLFFEKEKKSTLLNIKDLSNQEVYNELIKLFFHSKQDV